MIGSSEMVPSDNYSQQMVKMPDGSTSTVYSNDSDGSAQSVKFDKVDNGVITGSVSPISSKTGEIGSSQPFTAVHESIPGASRSGTSPVSDGESGAYYVSSHGDTNMFKPYSSSINGASATSPSSLSAGSGAVSQISKEMGHGSTDGRNPLHSAANNNSVTSSASYVTNSEPSVPLSSHGLAAQQTTDQKLSEPAYDQTASMSTTANAVSNKKNSKETNTSPSNLRRFSKNNPENFEVFKKTGVGNVEAFDKSNASDSLPNL